MKNALKKYISFIVYKIYSIFSLRIAFTANVFASEIDKTAAIRQKVRIYGSKLGKYSYVARESLVQNTEIGSFCSISTRCIIGLPAHPTSFLSTSPVFLTGGNYLRKHFAYLPFSNSLRTNIGNDVWIGANVLIKSGVSIGNGAIIGAGAIVTKDVPSYAIVAGVPARLIRFRFAPEVIDCLEKIAWWNFSDCELQSLGENFNDVSKFLDSLSNQGNVSKVE